MNTEKISNRLERKSQISFAYLFIAIGLILITLFPTQYTEGLSFTNQGIFFGTSIENFSFHNFGAVMLWIAAALYLMHYIYGAFTYPRKYEEVLIYKWVERSNHPDSNDLSYMRGVFATFIVLIAFIKCAPDLISPRSIVSWLIITLWLFINAILHFKTTTHGMFVHKELTIDVAVIDPINKGPQKISKKIETIFYDCPSLVNENDWKIAVAAKYMDHCRLKRTQEKIEESEIEKLSLEAYKVYKKRIQEGV